MPRPSTTLEILIAAQKKYLHGWLEGEATRRELYGPYGRRKNNSSGEMGTRPLYDPGHVNRLTPVQIREIWGGYSTRITPINRSEIIQRGPEKGKSRNYQVHPTTGIRFNGTSQPYPGEMPSGDAPAPIKGAPALPSPQPGNLLQTPISAPTQPQASIPVNTVMMSSTPSTPVHRPMDGEIESAGGGLGRV